MNKGASDLKSHLLLMLTAAQLLELLLEIQPMVNLLRTGMVEVCPTPPCKQSWQVLLFLNALP